MQKKIEVMRVIRVPPLGKLVVTIGEKSYENLDEIGNPVLKRQVLAAVGELVSFVNGYDALANAGYAPSRIPIGQGREEEPLTPEQERFLAELSNPAETSELDLEQSPIPTAHQTAPPPATVKPSPGSVPQTAVEQGSQEDAHAPPDSIAAQINAILARHLAQEDGLRGRDIHLEQSGTSGLRIMVDGRAYVRPGDIEDRHVQLVLRRALKEWDQT